jgi:hypothetical protein
MVLPILRKVKLCFDFITRCHSGSHMTLYSSSLEKVEEGRSTQGMMSVALFVRALGNLPPNAYGQSNKPGSVPDLLADVESYTKTTKPKPANGAVFLGFKSGSRAKELLLELC